MNKSYDVLVIGAGIVGLATAYRLLVLQPGLKIAVVEKEDAVAKHQSGNNSGVIHSGIYYKPDSLKAENCIRGYSMMLEFCDEYSIKYELCGKVIVAINEAELPALEILYKRGIENGLRGLALLDENGIKDVEPHAKGIKGIWVPQTGITDYKEVCLKLADLIKEMGGQIFLDNKVYAIEEKSSGLKISTSQQAIECRYLVNCAGLYSDHIAGLAMGETPDVKIIPFRGEYYMLRENKKHLVRNLIYPVPDPQFPFLGVHFTRRINGDIEMGPNAVLAFKKEGYKRSDLRWSEFSSILRYPGFRKIALKYWRTGVGEMHRSFSPRAFAKSLEKLVPGIAASDLVPAGAGVRAQACDKNGNLLDDFYFIGSSHALHVCNAPSPAATSSLSIGETIAGKVLKALNDAV